MRSPIAITLLALTAFSAHGEVTDYSPLFDALGTTGSVTLGACTVKIKRGSSQSYQYSNGEQTQRTKIGMLVVDSASTLLSPQEPNGLKMDIPEDITVPMQYWGNAYTNTFKVTANVDRSTTFSVVVYYAHSDEFVYYYKHVAELTFSSDGKLTKVRLEEYTNVDGPISVLLKSHKFKKGKTVDPLNWGKNRVASFTCEPGPKAGNDKQ